MPKSKLDALKRQLILNLEKDSVDFSKVLELSSEIARLDDQNVRFSVDAGHISRLGRELVGRQETAVSELIKNAYDADATQVKLTFKDSDQPGGHLIIEDNGHGMARSQLITGFMRLSSTDKIHEPISPKYKRTRAGRKGIGRFAAQRLGKRLTVITQTEISSKALRVEIDWAQFSGDLDLGLVANHVEEIEKQQAHGTTLIIHQLEESWTEAAIKRVYRYIADLIQPFPLSKVSKDSENDPGFEVKIFREEAGRREEVASVEKLVYEFALAEIEGVVDSNGEAIWSITSQRLEINDTAEPFSASVDIPNVNFQHLRNVYLRAYYYNYARKENFLPRNQRQIILDLAKERGGIRVYRNGFRVLPYGEPFDDWLKLDDSSARRVILPPHANINFFGFVQLTDLTGSVFEETASRENLIENDAYEELVKFISGVLKAAALRVAEVRERKKTASQKNWKAEDPNTIIKNAVDTLESLAERAETIGSQESSATVEGQAIAATLRSAVVQLLSASTEQEARDLLLADKLTMLRVLASLGQAIGEFTHEIKHLLIAMRASANFFINNSTNEDQKRHATNLRTNLMNFSAFASYFDRVAGENARREMFIQDMGREARIFFQELAVSARNRYGIIIDEPLINGDDIFTLPMHPSELRSILLNFYTNARKAIKNEEADGRIQISVGHAVKSHVYLQFADNGCGIDSSIQARIFDAFFSTSAPPNPDAAEFDEATGSGLGLSIVRDIVEGYDGIVELVDPPPGFRTCFRVELPEATQAQIQEYGY